jgi:hypothetical protein
METINPLIISGPISCIIFECMGKTFTMFGDKHGSREGGSKTLCSCHDLYLRPKTRDTDAMTLPYLLSKWLQINESKGIKTDFYLEIPPLNKATKEYRFELRTLIDTLKSDFLTHDKSIYLTDVLKTEITKIDYIGLVYNVLQEQLNDCLFYKNVKVSPVDLRQIITNKTYTSSSEIVDLFSLVYYPTLQVQPSLKHDIVEAFRFLITNSSLIDNFYFGELSYSKFKNIFMQKINETALDSVVKSLLLSKLTSIQELVSDNYHIANIELETLSNTHPEYYRKLLLFKTQLFEQYTKESQTFLEGFCAIVSFDDTLLQQQLQLLDQRMQFATQSLPLSFVSIEIYTLCKLLNSNSDNIIIYQGDKHIQTYLEFFSKYHDDYNNIEQVYGNEETPRCVISKFLGNYLC